MEHCIRWRATLDHYRASELIALRFSNDDAFLTALGVTEKDPEFVYELVGDLVLIIPKDALPLFHGLNFVQEGVRDASDLPADELNKLRREQGGY